jgi:hypothetical protein
LDELISPRPTLAIVVVACIALAGLLGGVLTSGKTTTRKRQNSLVYLVRADRGQAIWVSYDSRPDEWTGKYLGKNPRERPLAEMRLSCVGAEADWFPTVLTGTAPFVELAPPHAEILSDSPVPQGRRVTARIRSPRGAARIRLFAESPGPAISDVVVDGVRPAHRMPDGSYGDTDFSLGFSGFVFQLFGAGAKGALVELTIHSREKVPFTLSDASYGIPAPPARSTSPRPDNMTSKPSWLSDITVVQRSLEL